MTISFFPPKSMKKERKYGFDEEGFFSSSSDQFERSVLDEYLQDQELVERKRDQFQKKPKKMSFGLDCPICDAKGRDRDHVTRHFMDEL